MPSALFPDQPPDLPSPRTAARAYDELEGYQSSSPEQWIQSPRYVYHEDLHSAKEH